MSMIKECISLDPWIAADCFQCDCDTEGMHCCHRNIRDIPGCIAELNDTLH
ncbi:hypothetical protein E2320_006863, partial [Naja naja]